MLAQEKAESYKQGQEDEAIKHTKEDLNAYQEGFKAGLEEAAALKPKSLL